MIRLIRAFLVVRGTVMMLERSGMKDDVFHTRADAAFHVVQDALGKRDVSLKKNTIELLLKLAVWFYTNRFSKPIRFGG